MRKFLIIMDCLPIKYKRLFLENKRKILVIGTNGLIGKAIYDFFSCKDDVILLGEDLSSGFDITDNKYLDSYLKKIMIFNT